MTHFVFTNLQDAENAAILAKQSQNIPINYNGIPLFSVTKRYCDVIEYDSKFYIIKDSVTEAVSNGWQSENLIIPYEGEE